MQLVPMQVGGVDVLVEVRSTPGTEPTSLVDKALDKVEGAFARAEETIVAMSGRMATAFDALPPGARRPSEITVDFGLAFSASGDVIVSAASAEASLQVSVTFDLTSG